MISEKEKEYLSDIVNNCVDISDEEKYLIKNYMTSYYKENIDNVNKGIHYHLHIEDPTNEICCLDVNEKTGTIELLELDLN